MALTLILGCMFSGKTTELLRMVEREESIDRKVLVINHSHDSKRSGKAVLKTHSGKIRYVEYELNTFTDEILENIIAKRPDTIAINEGQFFSNLGEFVFKVIGMKINVIVCGLDSDFKREPFTEIVNLVPHANTLVKTNALCGICRDGTLALYSKRVKGGDSRIQVGGSDSYIPVCRDCYGVQ
jgi:thymidine kinase